MADIITALRSGINEQMLNALHSILRNVYATGRSSRGILRQVLQVVSSSDTPVALRSIGYEILWTLTAAVDSMAYRGLITTARNDMLTADHPDLTLTALTTLRSLPAAMSIDIMLMEDMDRSMCDAMSGDAPGHIRSLSAITFSRIAVHAWLQVSGPGSSTTAAGGTRANGITRSIDNHNSLIRLRTTLLDRALEVLRGVTNLCEDKDPEVSAGAFTALRTVFEAGPYATVTGTNNSSLPGSNSSTSRVLIRNSLLDIACSEVAASTINNNGINTNSSITAIRIAHLRLLRELCRRLVSRVGFLLQRIYVLKPLGRIHAIRTLTLLFAHAINEAAGRSGGLDAPAILRMDHAASTGEQPLISTVNAFISNILVPLATRPLGNGGLGIGNTAAMTIMSEQNQSSLTFTGNNVLNSSLQLECCRSFVQLWCTFGSFDGSLQNRSVAGDMVINDLDNVNGRSTWNENYGSLQIARALTSGALSLDTTNNYVVATLADSDLVEYNSFCGPLWRYTGGNPSAVRTHTIGSSITTICRRFVPNVLRTLIGLLRRIQTGGTSPGVVVTVAGSVVDTTTIGAVTTNNVTNNSASILGNNNGLNGPLTPNVNNSSSNDNSNLSNNSSQILTSGVGLGTGAGSSLLPSGFLLRTLHIVVRLSEMIEPSLFIHLCPAFLREIGRIGDDVVDDPGSGADHSHTRVRLLLRLSAMAVHAAVTECCPDRPLTNYTKSTGTNSTNNNIHSNNSNTNDNASTGPTYSATLARIMYEATRPLVFTTGTDGSYVDASGSSASLNVNFPASSASAIGNVHGAEIARSSIRYRSELSACMLQSLTRVAPTGAVVSQLAVATAHSKNDTYLNQLTRRSSRLTAAEILHVWLSFALDTVLSNLWILEHRLTYAGIATMSKDAAAATLARIIGNPDAPAPAPCPVPYIAPPMASVTGMNLNQGPGRTGDLTVGAVPDMFDPSMSMSTAGPSGGVGFVSGWAWAREYEAVAEAAETVMNLLCAIASLLLPPPVAKTYIPGAQESGATSIPSALALDMLPPAVLTSHRAGLQRILHLVSKQDLNISRMYELERAAHALAPRAASVSASLTAGLSASVSRGTTYDVLPSVVPLQMRLLWLLCAAWDGSDGGALTAGMVAAGTSAQLSLPRTVATMVMGNDGSGNAGGGNGLRALVQSVTQFERSATGNVDEQNTSRENELYRNTTLSIEAVRQKRLSGLSYTLASEAGIALGLAADLEAAAAHALYGTPYDDNNSASNNSPSNYTNPSMNTVGRNRSNTGNNGVGKDSPKSKTISTMKKLSAFPSISAKTFWSRGTKIGKALGLFGKQATEENMIQIDTGPAWTGEGTVVTHAHFWALLDCIAQLASSQRCTAGTLKRSVEAMLVQPKLGPDVENALLGLLPRISLWCAAYGRSQVAQELSDMVHNQDDEETDRDTGIDVATASQSIRSAMDSVSIFEAVAAYATACIRDPWSFTLYTPPSLTDENSTDPEQTIPSSVRTMLRRLESFKKADDPSAPLATLEMLADLHSQPALAAIAAAALPELTQNVTVGLNRSASSGAHMRTIAPVSAVHVRDVTSALAQISMHLSPSGVRDAALLTRGVCLPVSYLGSVPAETAIGGIPFTMDSDDPNPKNQLVPKGRTNRHRDAVLLDAMLKAHRKDPVLYHATESTTMTATATALSSAFPLDGSLSSDMSTIASSAETVILTSSSDPLTVSMGHTLHANGNRITLHIAITNNTHIRLPSGLRASLQLSAPLVFDRSAITTAMIASLTARLGSVNENSSGGMGSASAGSTLMSGDFITMQRTGQHHATHVLSQPLPPGCTVTWEIVVSVAGFGSPTVRVTVSFETVEPLETTSATPGTDPAMIQSLVRASRVIGGTRSAEDNANDQDEDIDWSTTGVDNGGMTGPWANPLLGGNRSVMAGDGLIWSGSDLNSSKRTSRILPAVPSPTLSISRTSATRAPVQPKQAPQPTLQKTRSALNLGFGSFGMSQRNLSVGNVTATPVKGTRRPSQQGSVAPSIMERDSEGDAASTTGGNTIDDDNASTGTGGGGGGTGFGGDETSNDNNNDELGEEGPGSSVRPYRVRVLEIQTQTYRISLTNLLLPVNVHIPSPLALALACGIDLLPGASFAFGNDVPCLLAAAAIEGSGVPISVAAANALQNPESNSSMSSAGSLNSLRNGLLSTVMARLPYVHHAIAVSQPFMAIPMATANLGFLQSSIENTEKSSFGLLSTNNLSNSTHAFLASAPMSSPVWLVSCAVEGTRGNWARIPLPVCPPLLTPSSKEVVADYASGVGAVLNNQTLPYSTIGGGTGPLITQAAFSARTWGGSSIVLFFTGILTPVNSTKQINNTPEQIIASASAIQPCIWQVSLQIRTDDARIRATIAAELSFFIHTLFMGRLSVLSHGHSPLPLSLLQRLDISGSGIVNGNDNDDTVTDTNSSSNPATPMVAQTTTGTTSEPITQSIANTQDFSAGLHTRGLADVWSGNGATVFNQISSMFTGGMFHRQRSGHDSSAAHSQPNNNGGASHTDYTQDSDEED